MKTDPQISSRLADTQRVQVQENQVGLLAWSLLAQPTGGMPGQPEPDSPQPPVEPGVPTRPDEPPPAPVA